MTATLIVECGKCGGLLMAKEDQKTRTCPYCGFQVNVFKVKKLASARNAYEASEILKNLKSEASRRQKSIRHLE
jgi:DNA-directed RNA polymerase subunit RPC12/RpoP